MATTTAADAVIARIEGEYRRRTPRSAALFTAAAEVVPGGTSRSGVAFRPYPLVIAHGQGCRIVDADGHEYLDFLNSNSALVHGHAQPAITAAIQQQAARGVAWAAIAEEEAVLGRLLRERVRSLAKVRFCSSGTEAGMYAARVARAFTGRDKLLKFEGGYHGSYDDVEVSKGPFRLADAGPPDDPRPVVGTLGFPRGTAQRVVVAPFNDRAVVERRLREHRDELAAVLVEPMIGAGGMIPPEDGFLPFLREITRAHGVLLVADEVVTFRLARGGGQERWGFDADLTMFGKTIGGGLPVGAIGGREDLLMLTTYEPDAPSRARLSLSGTFSGAALGMVAGRASVEALDAAALAHLEALGARLSAGLRAACARAGLRAQVTGAGSLLAIHFTDQPVREYRAAANAHQEIMEPLHLWLLTRGVYTYPRGAFAISTAMAERDVDQAAEAVGAGLEVLRPYVEQVAPELLAR